MAAIGLLLGLSVWTLRRWRRGQFSHRSALDLPFSLFLISAALGLLPAKQPEYGLARVWILVGCLLLYYTVINLTEERALKTYILLVAVLGFVTTVFLMSQMPDISQYVWEGELVPVFRPAFVSLVQLPKIQLDVAIFWSINRNAIAGASMVVLPIMLLVVRLSSRRSSMLIAIIGAVFLGLALAVSGWITSLVALCSALVLVMLASGHGRRAAAIGLATLVMFVLLFVRSSAYPLQNYALGMIGSRLDLWQTALYIIRDFPLTGVGVGKENWFSALPPYTLPTLPGVDLSVPCHEAGTCWLMHSHSFYLQTWVEQGIVGFVALVSIVVLGIWLGARYLRTVQGKRRAMVMAGLWSFSAFSIHSIVDAGPSSPAAIGLWAALGLIVAAGQPPGAQQNARAGKEDGHSLQLRKTEYKSQVSLLGELFGPVEWLGVSLLLTLVSLAIIGDHLMLAVGTAVGAGLALASASMGFHAAAN